MKKSKEELIKRYRQVRKASINMCEALEPECCRIQSAGEVSPVWWNLAHTSWFFVRNVLQPFGGKSAKNDHLFDYVLNSYYASLGPRLERDRRGLMTRPTLKEVYAYRKSVDERVEALIHSLNQQLLQQAAPIIEIGIQHEQQHQELFYTEIKHILYQNPPALRQPYKKQAKKTIKAQDAVPAHFIDISGGLYEFGNRGSSWGWDNEYPVHKHYIHDFMLQNRLVTNGEYLEFMEDGGYEKQLLWLDNGWNKAKKEEWKAPLYWEKVNGKWHHWTLSGMQPINPHEPVSHVSFYEAEAFATWKRARLPTEREWEWAARIHGVTAKSGNFLDSGKLHPQKVPAGKSLSQMLGDVWEWTSSYYEPYPGYAPFSGSLGEYNEKFMDNQRVLRGGSCVNERNHIRISYRNFWAPETRFQFTGIRLAKDGEKPHAKKRSSTK